LHGWNLGAEILESIYIAREKEDEVELAKRLSPGQKALYFIGYLEDEVTNGGLIQFYWNYDREYLAPILEGLKLVGDTAMLDLVKKANKEYSVHRSEFLAQKIKDDWQPLYDSLKTFETYDEIYSKISDSTIGLIEKYVRLNTSDFVKF